MRCFDAIMMILQVRPLWQQRIVNVKSAREMIRLMLFEVVEYAIF